MPENTNEQLENEKVQTQEQIDRKKRTEMRDKSTLITDSENANFGENDSNFFENKVFDVEELLNNGTEAEIIKINRLKEYGVTDEMIISMYKDNSSHVTTKAAALDTLSTIFDKLVKYISELPNAIVLDPVTGQIDYKASVKQGIKVGIYDSFKNTNIPDDFLPNFSENLIKELKLYTEKEKVTQKDVESFRNYLILRLNYDDSELKKTIDENIDASLNKSLGELNIPRELLEVVMRNREKIEESRYETDPELYEITSLEIAFWKATGTERGALGAQINEFYAKHPDMVGKVNVIDDEGNLKIPSDFSKYKKLYEYEAVVSVLDCSYNLTPDEFEKMTPKEKQSITIALFAGYNYKDKKNTDFTILAKECEKKLHELFPQIDLSDKEKNKKVNEIEFARIAKEILEIDIGTENLTYTELTKFCKEKLGGVTDNYLMHDKETFTSKDKLLDIQNANDNYTFEDAVNNYFNGSQIEMTEESKNRFDFLYKSYTVNSWIDDKNEALMLRYMSIQAMRENYKRSPETPYVQRQLEELDKQEKEFFDKHGEEFTQEFGDPQDWSDKKKREHKCHYSHYKNNKTLASITEIYTKDMIKFQNGVTYETLSDDDKKKYIRNTLAIYNMVKNESKESNVILVKNVIRRLELMNKDDQKFVDFDENGKPIIDENAIFEEYQKMSERETEWSGFEELVQASEQKLEKYVASKIAKLAELDKDEFEPIGSKQNLNKAYEKVEKTKIMLDVRKREKQKKKENTKKQKENTQKNEGTLEQSNEESEVTQQNKNPISNKEFAIGIKQQGIPIETIETSAITASKNSKETRKAEEQGRENLDVEEIKVEEIVYEDTKGNTSKSNPKASKEENSESNSSTGTDANEEKIDIEDTEVAPIGLFGKAKQFINNIFNNVLRRTDKTKKLPPGKDTKDEKNTIESNEDSKKATDKNVEPKIVEEPINYLKKQYDINHDVAQKGQSNDNNSVRGNTQGDQKDSEDMQIGG